MGKYTELTKLIEPLKTDSYGEWHFDENHMHVPYLTHTKLVHELFDAVIAFNKVNPDYNLYNYNDLLEERGLEWKHNIIVNADVKNMDGQGIMAMFTGLLRGERFCEGSMLAALKDGTVMRWLERLKKIDEQECIYVSPDILFAYSSKPSFGFRGSYGGEGIIVYSDGRIVQEEFVFGDDKPSKAEELKKDMALAESIRKIVDIHKFDINTWDSKLDGTLICDGSIREYVFGGKLFREVSVDIGTHPIIDLCNEIMGLLAENGVKSTFARYAF